MSTNISAPFEITGWRDEPWDQEGGVTSSQVTVEKTYSGPLVGTSVAKLVTIVVPDGAAAYSAVERVTATVDGRSGTFAMVHGAGPGDGGTTAAVTVLDGTGTGDLAGITGSGRIGRDDDGNHVLTLRYELG